MDHTLSLSLPTEVQLFIDLDGQRLQSQQCRPCMTRTWLPRRFLTPSPHTVLPALFQLHGCTCCCFGCKNSPCSLSLLTHLSFMEGHLLQEDESPREGQVSYLGSHRAMCPPPVLRYQTTLRPWAISPFHGTESPWGRGRALSSQPTALKSAWLTHTRPSTTVHGAHQ